MTCFEAFLRTIKSMPGTRTFLREALFSPTLDEAGRADHEYSLALVQGLIEDSVAVMDHIVGSFSPSGIARS